MALDFPINPSSGDTHVHPDTNTFFFFDGVAWNSTGTASTSGDFTVDGSLVSSDPSEGKFKGTNNCALECTNGDIRFYRQGSLVGDIKNSGDNGALAWNFFSGLRATNLPPISAFSPNLYVDPSGVIYQTSSSRRFKKDIEDYTLIDAKNFLDNARPVTYYPIDPNFKQSVIGFIAEELDEVEPRIVHYDDDGQPSGVQYATIVSILTKICQDQEARIKALEERLD